MLMMIAVVNCGAPTSVSSKRTVPTDSVNSDFNNSNLEAKANAKCQQDPQLSLAPAATVGYTDSIQLYLEDTCVGCHRTGGLPPDLSSYSKAKAAAAVSLASLTKGHHASSASCRCNSSRKSDLRSVGRWWHTRINPNGSVRLNYVTSSSIARCDRQCRI